MTFAAPFTTTFKKILSDIAWISAIANYIQIGQEM
jgi:hypothetical protein